MSDEEQEGGHERWLVSYADFMTLLFAFFTVLYATSEKNQEKTEKFQESVKKYLIKAGGGMGGAGSGASVNQGQLNNSVIEPPIKTYRDDKGEAAPVMERAETFVEGLSKEERKAYVADLVVDEWGVRVTIPSAVLFAAKDDKFKPSAMEFLKKLAGLLAKSERKVLIQGHVAAGETGNFRSTWDFSSARAVNLLRFMQKSENIPTERLSVAALGDTRPRYHNNESGNSRIEIVLLNPDMDF